MPVALPPMTTIRSAATPVPFRHTVSPSILPQRRAPPPAVAPAEPTREPRRKGRRGAHHPEKSGQECDRTRRRRTGGLRGSDQWVRAPGHRMAAACGRTGYCTSRKMMAPCGNFVRIPLVVSFGCGHSRECPAEAPDQSVDHRKGARMATRAVARRQAAKTGATDTASSVRAAGGEVADRDLVGMYLDEIARTPLLDAAKEVELSLDIEAGVYARADTGRRRGQPVEGRAERRREPRGAGGDRRGRASAPRTSSSAPTCAWSSLSPAGTRAAACRCWT